MRPFPDDPQWLQLSRKLPPDSVVLALLKFGFRASDIAARFDCLPQTVTESIQRTGFRHFRHSAIRNIHNGIYPRATRSDVGARRRHLPDMVVNF